MLPPFLSITVPCGTVNNRIDRNNHIVHAPNASKETELLFQFLIQFFLSLFDCFPEFCFIGMMHIILRIFFIIENIVHADMIDITTLCAFPFIQVIIKSFLFIEMGIACITIPFNTGKPVIQIITCIGVVILFRMEKGIQLIL